MKPIGTRMAITTIAVVLRPSSQSDFDSQPSAGVANSLKNKVNNTRTKYLSIIEYILLASSMR
jgi:hypothetical protein